MLSHKTKETFIHWVDQEYIRLMNMITARLDAIKMDVEESSDFEYIRTRLKDVERLERLMKDLKCHTPEFKMEYDQMVGLVKWFIINGDEIIEECNKELF